MVTLLAQYANPTNIDPHKIAHLFPDRIFSVIAFTWSEREGAVCSVRIPNTTYNQAIKVAKQDGYRDPQDSDPWTHRNTYKSWI